MAEGGHPDTTMPDLASLATAVSTMANTPEVITVAAQLTALDPPERTTEFDAAAAALADAIVATPSPALFADAAALFLTSTDLLEAAGARLAKDVLAQSAPPTDATGPAALRAADALEVATQLRLGGWTARWDLFALLTEYDGTGPVAYTRAALRAVQACFEQWPEADDLLAVAHRIAEASLNTSEGQSVSSDVGAMLARVELLQALRADGPEAAVRHIDDALVALSAALTHDDRPDAHVTANIARLLRGLIETQSVDPAVAAELGDGVRELRHLRYSRGHWTGDVAATTWAAWSLLADRLTAAQQRFDEPSWLHAVPVIDDLVDLYRVSGSYTGLRCDDDGHAVQILVAPVIANGFADEVGLMNVLRQRVAEMEAAAEDGSATEAELADLPAAVDIRNAAARRLAAGIPVRDPKANAGAEPPADDTTAGAALGENDAEERLWAAARRRHRTRLASASLPVNLALQQIWDDLEASTDYRTLDGVADAVDLVTVLLMAFLFDRSAVGPSEAPYLYDAAASEEDLARDLRTFVRGSGYLNGVDTEVRHVGGGRVDVRFSFPGFNLYVELKQDATEEPVPDKSSYLNQAASYEVAEPRIGFLLVLKKTPKKTPSVSVNDWAHVVEVTDAAGAPRHVVAMMLAGARTIPSNM